MAAETHHMSRQNLPTFLEHLKQHYQGRSLAVIEADVLVRGTGAFVRIVDRAGAESLFLSDVVILTAETIVDNYEQILAHDFSQSCLVTAESQTADIEKKLISGVHGPEVCILVHIQ